MSNEEENYDSDESVTTEDMNELLSNKPTYDGGVERSSKKKEKVIMDKKPKSKKTEVVENESEVVNEVLEELVEEEVKSKKPVKPKKERTPKQKEAFEKLLAKRREQRDMKKKIIEEHTEKHPIVKKPPGRPKTKPDPPQVVTKEVVTKVIYMIPNEDNTGYIESANPKPLTERQLKKIENEKKIKEQELEIGKKLYRTKKGNIDLRSKNQRTEKQIENSKKLVEFNKKRAADRKLEKEKKMKSMISEEVKDSMIDVVTKPIAQVKKERAERKPVITPEQQQEYEYKQHKSLFS